MIELPFPPAVLSPNARPHWGKRHRAAKKYKGDCMLLMSQYRRDLAGRAAFEITFYPPTAHRHDRDNLIARFKYGQDALAEITGVNDSEFVMTYRVGKSREGGAVIVRPV